MHQTGNGEMWQKGFYCFTVWTSVLLKCSQVCIIYYLSFCNGSHFLLNYLLCGEWMGVPRGLVIQGVMRVTGTRSDMVQETEKLMDLETTP